MLSWDRLSSTAWSFGTPSPPDPAQLSHKAGSLRYSTFPGAGKSSATKLLRPFSPLWLWERRAQSWESWAVFAQDECRVPWGREWPPLAVCTAPGKTRKPGKSDRDSHSPETISSPALKGGSREVSLSYVFLPQPR